MLALIPKVNVPERANQFRLIAICNTNFKMVTKILASRLSVILPNLIAPYQSSFIKGRSTVDNVLIFQKVIHFLKALKGKKSFMAINLDLEKAYGRIRHLGLNNRRKKMSHDQLGYNMYS